MKPIEPIFRMLAVLVVFFAVLLVVTARMFPNDYQTFQVIAQLLSGFAGALLAKIKTATGTEEPETQKKDKPS